MYEQINVETPIHDEKTIIQLIVFCAGGENFGVKIEEVREIIKIGMITPIPESPTFIKGIINVRGEIVTAIDIKARFSLAPKNEIESKHIIVTKNDDNLFGLIVDEVIEVLRMQKKDIKSAPSFLDKINEKYVSGIVSHEERLIILLDIDQVLSRQELIQMARATKSYDKKTTSTKGKSIKHK